MGKGLFHNPVDKAFENIMGKEKMVINSFVPFPQNAFYSIKMENIVWPAVNLYAIALNFVNSLPKKTFADDKINITEKFKFVLGRVESIVGKRENAGYQDFLLFPQWFQKVSYTGSLKVVIVW